MTVYALTGGIGMGKSTAAFLLQQRSIPVIDTDVIARQITEPGQSALVEIKSRFGDDIVDESGRLRRDAMGAIVFNDLDARKDLESILHPRIRRVWRDQVELWREQGKACAVVVIPLLFETDAQAAFDKVICMACTAETQLERLKMRGWDDDHSASRIAAQWSIEQKMSASDFVIWTDSSLRVTAMQLEIAIPELGGLPEMYSVDG